MIQESLKVIAEFKDNASAGIQKLKDNLSQLSGKSQALKPLEQQKAVKNINDLDKAAKNAAAPSGGIGALAQVMTNLKGSFADLATGGKDLASSFGSTIVGAAESTSAALAGIGAATAGVGAAISTVSRNVKLDAAQLQDAVKIFRDASAAATGGEKPENVGKRAVYSFLRKELGLSADEARKLRGEVSRLSYALKQTETPAKSLASIFRVGLFGGGGTDKLVRSAALRGLIPVFGAIASAGAAVAATAGSIGVALNAAADDAAELAEKLGISVDRLEALKLIANETGTSVEGLQKTYDRLAKVLDKTDEESDKAAISLANLGLGFEEIKALKPEDAAARILQRYEELGKTAEATAAVQLLLGSNFRESSLGIKEAAKNFDEYAKRVKEFGAGDSKLLAAQGAEQEKAFNNLSLALKGFGVQIAENIGPLITRLVQSFAEVINVVRQTGIVGKLVNGIFSVLNLVLYDFGKLLGGVAATLVAFFSGEFKQAWEIAKMTVKDATDAVVNFGDRSKDSAAESVAAAQAAEEAAKKEADAKKTAAQLEAERLKKLAEAKKKAEEQLKLFNDAKTSLEQQLGLLGKETELEKMLWETQKGRYKDLNEAQKVELVALAGKIDAKNKELQIAEKLKSLQGGIAEQQQEVSLAEEELRFTGLSADERERQVYLLRELNRLRQEGNELSEIDQQNLADQVKRLADRRKALKDAQSDAKIINDLVDNSYATISARVQRNITIAAKLLEERKISEIDYVRFVKEQIAQLTAFNQEAAEETTEFWREAARGIQQSLSQFFFDFMQGKLTDLAGSFKRVIDQMVAQALAARLAEALFGKGFEKGGSMGGFVGQAASFLGGLFGGGRASGGPVSAGKAYLVGEKGPELAVFGQSGQVIPNQSLQSMGSNVTFNISAMDGQDVVRTLKKSERELAKMFSSANNRYNLAGV